MLGGGCDMTEETKMIMESLNGLREEIVGVKSGLQEEIAGVKSGLHEEIAGVKDSLHEEITGVKDSLHGEITEVKDSLHEEIAEVCRRQDNTDEVLRSLKISCDENFRNIEIWQISTDARLKDIGKRQESAEDRLKRLEFLIENDLHRDISIVAEGHLDLMRNMHEMLRIDSEKDEFMMRFDLLESKVKSIEERVDTMASAG